MQEVRNRRAALRCPVLPYRLGVLPQPGFEAGELKSFAFIEAKQELVGLQVIEFQSKTVHAQERARDGNSRPLIPIDKRMILRKALKQRGSLFDDVPVISTLGTSQSRFEGAQVANTLRPAIQNNQARVSGQHLVEGGVERH